MPLVLTIAIFVFQTFIHPYRNIAANYIESVLFLWLVCLLGLGNTTALQDSIDDSDGEVPRWPDALLYIPVAVGLVVAVVHSSILLARYSHVGKGGGSRPPKDFECIVRYSQ